MRVHFNIPPTAAADILTDYGVDYSAGPVGTCIEGDWELAMTAIEACHRAVARENRPFVTTVVFDEAI